MQEDMFSKQTIDLLEASGWRPERKISIDHWIEKLESEGYLVLQEAKEILESFGELTVVPLKTEKAVYASEVLRFDPILAGAGEYDRISYWENRLGVRMTPIAEIGGGATLLIAGNGEVYSSWDRFLSREGVSFEDAIEHTLIKADRMPEQIGEIRE